MDVGTGLPVYSLEDPRAFIGPDEVAAIAAGAERAGFDSISVVEHPFPDEEWLRDGNGHHSFDPFVALSFAAAATSRIKLRTGLLILPYRNPFLAARAVASLDHLSHGRVVLGVGTGYLPKEFRALGVDFDERNELADEAIVAMRRAWTDDVVVMTGRHWKAEGNTMLPHPVQPGGPPIFVGGNSRRAIRRAVELGDGWLPMPYAGNAISRRTAPITSIDELRARLDYAASHAVRVGRTSPLRLSVGLSSFAPASDDDDTLVETAHALARLGATETAAPMRGGTPGSLSAHLDALAELGGSLVPRLHQVSVTGVVPAMKP